MTTNTKTQLLVNLHATRPLVIIYEPHKNPVKLQLKFIFGTYYYDNMFQPAEPSSDFMNVYGYTFFCTVHCDTIM